MALLVVAVLSEWPLGLVPWSQYALIAGLVSGFLILVITLAVVDDVLERRNRVRWEAVAHTAFRGLGEAVGDVGEALEVVVTGRVRPGRNHFDPPWGEAFGQRIGGLALDDVPANRYGSTEFRPFHATALRRRLQQPEWCDVAQRATVRIRSRLRVSMTPWLAAMLATPELAAVQNRVALLDLRLMRLQAPVLELARMGEAKQHKGHPRAHFQWLAYEMWQATHVEVVALAEGLYRAARGDSSYVHVNEPARNRLDSRHVSYLEGLPETRRRDLTTPVVADTLRGRLVSDYQVVPEGARQRRSGWFGSRRG